MEQVFTEIKESVEKEAKQLISRAKRVAEREIQHAREDAESVLASNREVAEKAAKLRVERAVARIETDVRKQQLEQQQHLVQKVFDAALQKMKSLPRDDKYTKWLKALLDNALKEFPDEKALVFCNEKDTDIVKKLLAGSSSKIAEKHSDISGGIIIKSIDERLTIDCSAESELRRAKEELRDTVLEKLNLNY